MNGQIAAGLGRDLIAPLCEHISASHLDGRAAVAADTPLLEWGVLDSLAFGDLLAFIEQRFQISVPLEEILPANFRSVEEIASLLERLRSRR